MEKSQGHLSAADRPATSHLRILLPVFLAALLGAGIVITLDHTYISALGSTSVGGEETPGSPPVVLFSGSYLIGFIFGLACVIAREAGHLRTARRMTGACWLSQHSPRLTRGIITSFYCLALGGGCLLLSSQFRCLLWWCILLGALPPVFLAVGLSRNEGMSALQTPRSDS